MQASRDLSIILDKLAADGQFRDHLQRDPVAALARIGITLHPDDVPAEVHLPSQAAVAAEKEELLSTLETTATMLPFLLSGKIAA